MESEEHFCPVCGQNTDHYPVTIVADDWGCINAACNRCGHTITVEVIDPDLARDFADGR
jgi:transcription elongation factor Elf1